MNLEMFSVLDMVAERYLNPFFAENVGTAIRSFGAACEDPEHQFGKYPEDYALYHIGSFDAELGVIEPLEARKIANAITFVQKEADIVHKEGRA